MLKNTTKRLLFVFCLLSYEVVCYGQTGKLIIVIEGIQADKRGELSTGIFVKENFPEVGRQLLGREDPVSGPRMQITFDNVPVGTYGVACFQDIDKNKALNANFVGFPTEPIGFSRDARIRFGPPRFEDAAIAIEESASTTIRITLR
jgi:uncharacterized protein (DUF2141 family)